MVETVFLFGASVGFTLGSMVHGLLLIILVTGKYRIFEIRIQPQKLQLKNEKVGHVDPDCHIVLIHIQPSKYARSMQFFTRK